MSFRIKKLLSSIGEAKLKGIFCRDKKNNEEGDEGQTFTNKMKKMF